MLIVGSLMALEGLSPAVGQEGTDVERLSFRIGYLLSENDALSPDKQSALRGAMLGAQETSRTAELLDQHLDVIIDTASGEASIRQAARRLVETDSVFAIAGGFDPAVCETLQDVAASHNVLFFNIGCANDDLRGQGCHRHTFHIASSETMRQHARSEDAPAVLWHPSLFRYGASQLNERFEESVGGAMDGPAWSSWMALKILWESVQRTQTTDARQLIRYLESEDARFDGHKGRSLTFRPWNHQLRQPMYRLQTAEGSSEEAEQVPHATNDEEMSSRTLLDQIGVGKDETDCRFQSLPD